MGAQPATAGSCGSAILILAIARPLPSKNFDAEPNTV
jgi:hypothetical protein